MCRTVLSCGLVCIVLGCADSAGGPEARQDARVADLIKKLGSNDVQAKLAALVTLADLGAAAQDAVPALVQALQTKNEDVRLNAAIALGKIGKASVPAVVKLLDSGEADIRYYAVWTLGWVGPDAKNTAPRVIRALADKDESVRRKAAYALGRIAPDAKTAVGPLIQAFADSNGDVRALGKLGPAAVPVLVDALADKQVDVRRQAAQVLVPLRISDKMVVLALAHAAKDDDGAVRQQCLRGLQMLGAGAKPAAAMLV